MSSPTFKVDFFLAGFPKCGTTLLGSYLAAHSNICFSRIKEPFFFCTDFPNRRVVTSWSAYQRLFKPTEQQTILGEGTVCYVYSRPALEKIRDHNPNAKLLFMVRNPIELVDALHANQLRVFDEDIESLERAWEMQSQRLEGQHIPTQCAEPGFLQYKEMGCQGKHISHVLEMFPRDQVLILFNDDLRSAPEKVYNQALGFLGLQEAPLPPSGKPNVNLVYKHNLLGLAGKTVRRITKNRSLIKAKQALGIPDLHTGKMIQQFFMKEAKRRELSPAFKKHLANEFNDDVLLLSQITSRNLSNWMEPQ